MRSSLMNGEDFGSFKFLILKYRRGARQIIQPFCRIGSPIEIRSALFNLKKFSQNGKSTAESSGMLYNLMNDKEFGSFKFLILKPRSGDQIIQLFCRSGSPHEIRTPLLNLRQFLKTEKGTTHVECIQI